MPGSYTVGLFKKSTGFLNSPFLHLHIDFCGFMWYYIDKVWILG